MCRLRLIQLLAISLMSQGIIQSAATIVSEHKITITPEQRSSHNDWELLKATKHYNVDKVKASLKGGANVNATNGDGETALLIAAYSGYGYTEIVKLLIEAKADVNFADIHKNTALIYAAMLGNKEIIELLIKAGAHFNVANIIGYTPLIFAARDGYQEIVELLLRAGSDIDLDARECTNPHPLVRKKAIDHARESGYPEIIEMLENEPARRADFVKSWIRKLISVITETTDNQILPGISQIISEYFYSKKIEYLDLPLQDRLKNQLEYKKIKRCKCIVS